MQDKLIQASPRKSHEEKTFNIVSLIGLCFIFLTAGFMIWQNVDLSERLSEKEIVATAFAEGIQTMCYEDNIKDRYIRMCGIAENYAEESRYLDQEIDTPSTPRDIADIDCGPDETTIIYSDGTEAVTETRCNTTDK